MTEADRKEEIKSEQKLPGPGIGFYLIPLLALFLGAGIGKWISLQKNLIIPAEAKLGRAAHLLLGADNPSLILGVLCLILSLGLIWNRARPKTGKGNQPESPDRIPR